MTLKPLILFDIDGTLLMTGGVGRRAVNRVFFELFGIEDSWNHYDPMGKTDPGIINDIAQASLKRSLTVSEAREVYRRYVRYMADTIEQDAKFRVLPGVSDTLQRLQERGYPLGLATGNIEPTAWMKVRRGGLERYFPVGGFGSDSPERSQLVRRAIERASAHFRRAFATSEVVLVGDARQDVEAGLAVGVAMVAVATGRLSAEELGAFRPTVVLDSFQDASAFWRLLEQSG